MIESCLSEIQLDWKGRGLDLVRTSLGWRFQTKGNTQFIFKDYTPRGPPNTPEHLLET